MYLIRQFSSYELQLIVNLEFRPCFPTMKEFCIRCHWRIILVYVWILKYNVRSKIYNFVQKTKRRPFYGKEVGDLLHFCAVQFYICPLAVIAWCSQAVNSLFYSQTLLPYKQLAAYNENAFELLIEGTTQYETTLCQILYSRK